MRLPPDRNDVATYSLWVIGRDVIRLDGKKGWHDSLPVYDVMRLLDIKKGSITHKLLS